MSVPLLHRDPLDAQRLPGCGHGCVRIRTYNETTGGLQWMLAHNPATHEQYGAIWALHRDAQLVFRTGPLTVDCRRMTATVHGRLIRLTQRETQVLACLGARLSEIVPYGDLMAAVWDDRDVENHCWNTNGSPSDRWHSVRVLLARLRAKLGDARRLLVTHPPLGIELVNEAPP